MRNTGCGDVGARTSGSTSKTTMPLLGVATKSASTSASVDVTYPRSASGTGMW
jgi:hypothetical protein